MQAVIQGFFEVTPCITIHFDLVGGGGGGWLGTEMEREEKADFYFRMLLIAKII
jgi:hypothetical protein